MSDDARTLLGGLRDGFFEGWSRGNWEKLQPSLAAETLFISNQHRQQEEPGGQNCAAEWQRLLGADLPYLAWMRTSNHAIVVDEHGQAACSSYVMAGFSEGARHLLFGASVVLRFRFDQSGGRWMVRQARLNVNWCRGDARLVPHWRMPPQDGGWQLGDPAPVLVSEIDSPWALLGAGIPFKNAEHSIAELYSKYSWAIDQGDIALLSDCYTEDAAGGFTPIGALQGRHAIVGQLKSFRRHWPWMQHFADVVRLEIEADGQHARMIVARIIPERPFDGSGQAMYGAHYQMRVRHDTDGLWRICWSDYRPGWFTIADIPAFDIGVVHPQQKGSAT